jgi:hypothetical protein
MMTFSEKIAHVSQTDPDYGKAVKRLRIASWIFGIGLAFALLIAIQTYVVNGDQGTTINTFTNSACARAYGTFGHKPAPADSKAVRECESLRLAIAKAEGVAGPCVLYQRATGHQGALCPRFYVHPLQ